MSRSIVILLFVFTSMSGISQSESYFGFIKQADSLYKAKEYRKAAVTFTNASKENNWKLEGKHRYNAACCWSLCEVSDSAFFHLEKLISENFTDYGQLATDLDFQFLETDKRWKSILQSAKANKDRTEQNLNQAVADQLEAVFISDQRNRKLSSKIGNEFGRESETYKDFRKIMGKSDSCNVVTVTRILDQYGWLSDAYVGQMGSNALFLTIQHAHLKVQEKYLQMLQEAVKNGTLAGHNLAMLVDRIELGKGKRQIYGTQIGIENETRIHFVRPLDDPDNVDKRRAEVGLPPLSEYLKKWNVVWDVEQYKKDLPVLEEKFKK